MQETSPRLQSHRSRILVISTNSLPQNITELALFNYFSNFGKISNIRISLQNSRKSLKYEKQSCVIEFSDKFNTEKIIKSEHLINGAYVSFKRKSEKSADYEIFNEKIQRKKFQKKIFVNNIPNWINSNEKLEELIGEFGKITSIERDQDKKNFSKKQLKPFAIITFESKYSAFLAIQRRFIKFGNDENFLRIFPFKKILYEENQKNVKNENFTVPTNFGNNTNFQINKEKN